MSDNDSLDQNEPGTFLGGAGDYPARTGFSERMAEIENLARSVFSAVNETVTSLEEQLESISAFAAGPVDEIESLKETVEKFNYAVSGFRAGIEEAFAVVRRELDDFPAHGIQEFDTLLDMIHLVNTEMDPVRLQDLIMDIAIRVTRAERGFLLLADGKGGELTFSLARNMDSTDLDKPENEVSRRIIGDVVRGGRMVMVHDALSDDRFSARESIRDLKLRSILAFPLKFDGSIIGLIYLDNRAAPGIFSKDDAALLERLADQMAAAVMKTREIERLESTRRQLESELKSRYRFDGIVTVSEGMHEALRTVGLVAATDASILILGKSGTGKELVAKALHANSDRAGSPFVFVNCAAIPEHLLESELFGYERGAFTGAVQSRKGKIVGADGGTLFLDEIGDMAPTLQAKLLRVLQEKIVEPLGSDRRIPVDMRLVAATNRNIEKMVEEGTFREDLYYRLNVITVNLPPLRDRKEDIPVLTDHFLKIYCRKYGKETIEPSRDFRELLENYDFPGNVRELENLIQRVVALTESGGSADKDLLPSKIRSTGRKQVSSIRIDTSCKAGEYRAMKEEVLAEEAARMDREYLLQVLRKAGGVMTEAGRIAGLDRRQLYRMAKSSGISLDEIRREAVSE